MQKLKIVFIVVTLFSCLAMIALPIKTSYADLDPYSYNPNNSKTAELDQATVVKYTSPIYNIAYTIAIIATIISLAIIGIKFIVGSAQEKAEYKEHLMPVLIGICTISFIITIIGTLAKFADIF